MAVVGKIDRRYMAHFLDSNFGQSTPKYSRIGKNLEEYTIELNPDTETSKNILGESTFVHNGYEATATADEYFADTTDDLFEHLQDIVDNRHKDDNCKTTALEVHLWDGNEEDGYVAYRQDCYVIPTSYGGDTAGYQIPFTVNYVGARTKGVYTPSTGAFVAD